MKKASIISLLLISCLITPSLVLAADTATDTTSDNETFDISNLSPEAVKQIYQIDKLLTKKRYSYAASQLKKFLKANPEHGPSWNNLGMAYESLHKYFLAKDAYQKAYNLTKDNDIKMARTASNNLCALAGTSLLNETKKDPTLTKTFIDMCEASTKLTPNEAKYWMNLSITYSKLDRTNDAVSAIEKAVNLEPENARYAYIYGLTLSDNHGDEKMIVDAFKKAIKTEPGNWTYTSALADYYEQQKEYHQDLEFLLSAESLYPVRGEINERIAKAYAITGDTKNAEKRAKQWIRNTGSGIEKLLNYEALYGLDMLLLSNDTKLWKRYAPLLHPSAGNSNNDKTIAGEELIHSVYQIAFKMSQKSDISKDRVELYRKVVEDGIVAESWYDFSILNMWLTKHAAADTLTQVTDMENLIQGKAKPSDFEQKYLK